MSLIVLAIALTLGSLQAAGSQAAPPAPAPNQSAGTPGVGYVVGPNDTLNIRVFDEPALSGTFKLDGDGSITYPLLGRVDLNKKTAREIEQLLTTMLADGYVNKPRLSVDVVEFRSRRIFVVGEVRQPGTFSIEGEVTLLEVLARAGSLTATASNQVLVLRKADPAAAGSAPALPDSDDSRVVMRINLDELKAGRMAGANTLLQDGDTIVVTQADRFYISGFVRTPGSFPLAPNMTVEQAIAVAGGLSDRGSKNGIKIRRTVNGKEVEISAKPTDRVQAGDTIVIRQRFI